MREKNVESAFINAVKEQGGLALKLVSPGFNGMPDRLVIFPGGIIAFVEVKAPGKKPRALQLSRHRLLKQFGFRVHTLDKIDASAGSHIDRMRIRKNQHHTHCTERSDV